MPSCWATRRASSTSATEQQPVSLSPPHSRMGTPTTSPPPSANRAAAPHEATPPRPPAPPPPTSPRRRSWPRAPGGRSSPELPHGGGDHGERLVDVGVGG